MIDVRALAEQVGGYRTVGGVWLASMEDLTRFARLVLEAAADAAEKERDGSRVYGERDGAIYRAGVWGAACAVRRLAPEEGKP